VRDAAEVLEGPHMGIQERELIAALVEPHEVSSGVHQPHHEFPNLPHLAALLDSDLEEVCLGFLARAMDDEWDEHTSWCLRLLSRR
jgi:hypothetical protein